jgi:hypothetical protein
MEKAVQETDGGGVFGQEPSPLLEGPVAADAECPPLMGGGDEAEQQLGTEVGGMRQLLTDLELWLWRDVAECAIVSSSRAGHRGLAA